MLKRKCSREFGAIIKQNCVYTENYDHIIRETVETSSRCEQDQDNFNIFFCEMFGRFSHTFISVRKTG